MSVIMHEDSEMLQEVLVTGYTTQRKADLTGSISVVSIGRDCQTKRNQPKDQSITQGRASRYEHQATVIPSLETPLYVFAMSGTVKVTIISLYVARQVYLPTKLGMLRG